VNATVAGRVIVGAHTLIGAGATIIDGVSVCDQVVVGAGGVVVRDILTPGVYVGIPAQALLRTRGL
jgi:UDP-N-acetylbacillosamine N-acetyltransferase